MRSLGPTSLKGFGARSTSSFTGTIEEPIETDDGFLVVRFDGTIEPSLDDPSVRQRIRNELFEIWVAERLERLDVELVGR